MMINKIKSAIKETSERYWTRHNVTLHHKFKSPQESLDYIEWRNLQHPYYIELMPVNCMTNKVVLDYGCGPGHDVVGIATESKPTKLIAMDVSSTSLAETMARIKLHSLPVELIQIKEIGANIPLPNAYVDVIHSSGVLHHTSDPIKIMKEFRRIMRPGGYAQVMVYNRNSIWMHMYVAYQRMLVEGLYAGASLEEAFRGSTDGPDCPISNCYTPEQFIAMANEAGLNCILRGASFSAWEMKYVSMIWEAMMHKQLPSESRRFLYDLTYDGKNIPLYHGVVAGINACYNLEF